MLEALVIIGVTIVWSILVGLLILGIFWSVSRLIEWQDRRKEKHGRHIS